MRPVKKIWWALLLAMPFFVLNAVLAQANDDETPDVTARVARISFMSGSVQIKRGDQTDWERATGNLPLVEGDEIVSENGARLEIQFNSETYLRLSENARLKVTTLRDEGIAVSLPNGSLSLRVLDFDKAQTFFEIDAPQTTVSIEKAGMYRVDAGSENDAQVRVSVTDAGQARVYSENSGFTLKNGRSATVQIGGDLAGEWEITDAAKYADDFDKWVLGRDTITAQRLQNADYDKYYDRDIFGAEDLSEYGEWIHTKKYGYVWRPYRAQLSAYSDWSPYRYGQWRWLSPYGWTWVNDEPWGWATYHHGRWVHDRGDWFWSPYPQTRGRRSWWRPALVVLSHIGSNVCWYPLPYHYDYYNYNSYYVDRRRYNTTIINNTTVVVNPAPNPTPRGVFPTLSTDSIKVKKIFLPAESVPANGVVTVDSSSFGRGKGKFRVAASDVAVKVLSETPSETIKPAMLPNFKDLSGRISREIIADQPVRPLAPIKTGAIERTSGAATGESLRRTRILGNRPPIENTPRTDNNGGLETQSPIRGTGAVKRQPRSEPLTNDEAPIRPTPGNKDSRENPIRPTGGGSDENGIQSPGRTRRGGDNQETAPPSENPTARDERIQRPQQPRRERPEPVREEPVRAPVPREENRRIDISPRIQPRREEPRREEPKNEEPVRPLPPPKEDSPPDIKPDSPNEGRRKRDGK